MIPFPRLAASLLVLALPFAATAAAPDAAPDAAAMPDGSIAPLLDAIGYPYELDEDGDYKLVLEMPDSDRTQLVFVRSQVEDFGSTRIREIWSPAWAGGDGPFPGQVADHLLRASSGLKLGGWVRQERYAVLVVKLPADVGAQVLEDAVVFAAMAADAMEVELSGVDGSDEF